MNRQRIGGGLALVLIVSVVIALRLRSGGAAPLQSPSPQDAVYAMFDAARTADVPRYLECFGGSLAATLRQEPRPALEAYLRTTYGPLTGVVVGDPEKAGDQSKLKVELVYAAYNEIQFYYVSSGRIVRLDPAERVKPAVPYGTPVTPR